MPFVVILIHFKGQTICKMYRYRLKRNILVFKCLLNFNRFRFMVKIMSLITHTQPFTLLVALRILTMHANYLKSIKGYSTLLEIIGCEGNSLLLDGNCIHHHALHCA